MRGYEYEGAQNIRRSQVISSLGLKSGCGITGPAANLRVVGKAPLRVPERVR